MGPDVGTGVALPATAPEGESCARKGLTSFLVE